MSAGPLPPAVGAVGARALRVLRGVVEVALPPSRPPLRRPGLKPRGLREFAGLGTETLRTAARSASSMAALGTLGGIAFLAAFVVWHVGIWVVLVAVWSVVGFVVYRLRGAIDWSRVGKALRDDPDAGEAP